MKIDVDLDAFRFTGKGSADLRKRPTELKKRLVEDSGTRDRAMAEFREEIDDLQQMMYADDRSSLLLIFQAMDAAGKDGTIRNVMSGINPHGVDMHSFKVPSDEELDHDYLWRAAKRLPPRGHIGIFNRSYYEEVLVVRVHPETLLKNQRLPPGTAKPLPKLWKHRYRQIRSFERHLHENGTRVVKFFLHVSKEEQRKRLLDRIEEPDKTWKFNPRDVRERAFWKQYMEAYAEAIDATATRDSPWYIVPADHKPGMRLIVCAAVLHEIRKLPIAWPRVPDEQLASLAACRETLTAEAPGARKSGAADSKRPKAAKKRRKGKDS